MKFRCLLFNLPIGTGSKHPDSGSKTGTRCPGFIDEGQEFFLLREQGNIAGAYKSLNIPLPGKAVTANVKMDDLEEMLRGAATN